MKPFSLRKYQPADAGLWNDFISRSKNATFLFHRDFMEYHQDRFQDFSLLVFQGEKLRAVFPANSNKEVLESHQGLSYGGLLLTSESKLFEVIAMFKSLLEFVQQQGFSQIRIKSVPGIYHKSPSDEMDFVLFLAKATIYRKDVLSVIELQSAILWSPSRKEGVRRGQRNALSIKEEQDAAVFWNELLVPNLEQKHNVKPVHSLAEISLLRRRFPENIRFFTVYHNQKAVAGCTVFETETLAHMQYISGNEDKNELGAIDFLHDHLIKNVFAHKRYFDFGNSNGSEMNTINQGLLFWKEGFGARSIVQDFYQIDTANHFLLENSSE